MRDQHCEKPTFLLPVPEPAQSCFFSRPTSFQLYDGVTRAVLISHCIIKQRTGLGRPRSLTYTGFWCEAQSFAASSLVSRNLLGPQPWYMTRADAWLEGQSVTAMIVSNCPSPPGKRKDKTTSRGLSFPLQPFIIKLNSKMSLFYTSKDVF